MTVVSFGKEIDVDVTLTSCFGANDIPDLVAEITISDVLNNGQASITEHTVSGLYLGSNYNIQLATDLSAMAGIEISHMVLADDTLQIIVVNNTGNNGMAIPDLIYNIYKL